MLTLAATNRNPRRQQQADTRSVPAPVGGLNDRDALGAMDEKDAVIMDNLFPLPSKVIIRRGALAWSTSIGSAVESLMGYNPKSGTASLFAAAGTSFYNVTSTGSVGAAVVTGLTNARWQRVNMSTGGGNFLMAVNGSDKLRGWDGSAWWIDGDGAHDITGVDTAQCIGIELFKRRVWLIQKNTASVWYLPVDSIAGAASELSFGSIFRKGGQLMAMANWSLDAGSGIDDYAAFISDQGEVALYKGSDPTSATTWALVGVFLIGAPIGRRCVAQFAGDVLVICKDGLVPLSKALMSSRVNTSIALTDKIQNAISVATTSYGANFGWQPIQFPGENMVVLNVPIATGAQQQYAMNTISGAWGRFKGWAANCFELFNDELYFGANGIVYKAWSGRSDGGTAIAFECLPAFNYFGARDTLKQFTMARPLLAVTSSVSLLYGLNTDFDMSQPTGTTTITTISSGQWNVGQWNSAQWGGQTVLQKSWQTVGGIGYCGAFHMMGSTATGNLEWSATDYAFKRGGIL